MNRLSRYLLRLFWKEAIALFAVAALLLFLIQCLRLFDVISDKGQSLWTLLGQAGLGMPSLAILFLYICLGIGLGRALRGLQGTTELAIIHVNALTPALLRAIGLYAVLGAVLLLVLAHVADPLSKRASNDWTASIAADLVSRSMVPHRFTQLVPGVDIAIGSRDAAGNISDFFADDRRDDQRQRTYFAKSAIISRDEQGYILTMHDGAIQYMTADKRFSQISFTRYDLALDQLTSTTKPGDRLEQTPSLELVSAALRDGKWSSDTVKTLLGRSSEGLRVLAICAFVAAIAAFPTGKRRRFELPAEIAVLGAAFAERAVTAYAGGPGILGVASGSVLLLAVSLVILLWRLRVLAPVRRRRALA